MKRSLILALKEKWTSGPETVSPSPSPSRTNRVVLNSASRLPTCCRAARSRWPLIGSPPVICLLLCSALITLRRSTFAVMSGAPEISRHTLQFPTRPRPTPPEHRDTHDSFRFNQVCACLAARRDPAANSEDFRAGQGDSDSPVTEEELFPPRQTGQGASVAPDEFSIFI